MMEEGDKKAGRMLKMVEEPSGFLSTIQIGITLAGFLGSAFAAENFSDPLVDWLVGLGVTIPPATLNTLAVILITLILSFFTLVFGELVPKRIAMKQSEKVALNISGLITVISKLFAPIVWLLSASTNGILRLLGIDPNEAEEQGIPTYEDILRLDKKRIAAADYRLLDTVDCIFVETAADDGGYIERYWVSVSDGLLCAAEKLQGEDVVYRMAGMSVDSGNVAEDAFTLPDGTVLHESALDGANR